MRERADGSSYRGWHQNDANDKEGRIPWLARIPLFSSCFTSEEQSSEQTPEPPRPYTPRHLYRDALRSCPPEPPVLPRELRCANSDFAADRLQHRSARQFEDDKSYLSATESMTYIGKGKAPSTSSSSMNMDHLGAPRNPNMALAARSMPIFGSHGSASLALHPAHRQGSQASASSSSGESSSASSAPTPAVGLKNGDESSNANTASHMLSSRFPEHCAADQSESAAPSQFAREQSHGNGRLEVGSFDTSKPETEARTITPGLHLAHQRRALRHSDAMYFRHGHNPERIKRGHAVSPVHPAMRQCWPSASVSNFACGRNDYGKHRIIIIRKN